MFEVGFRANELLIAETASSQLGTSFSLCSALP